MKTVYQTNPEGYFTEPVQAYPSPRELGVWLIPGGAVEVAPPALAEGQRARWNGAAWDVIDPEPDPELEPEPEPTPEELKAQITRAIDAHVEDRARAMKYNGAAHLASYVASTVPEWAAEARAFVAWRDLVWLAALEMLAQAQETGVIPSAEAVVAELPEWPGVEG